MTPTIPTHSRTDSALAVGSELAEQTRRVVKTNRGNTSFYRIYRVEQKEEA